MLITELESPFSRRKKRKILKEQEQRISIQEALRLTSKTFLGEEPEPDYSDTSELEPDYDDDDVAASSYNLVSADASSSSHTQSSNPLKSGGVLDVDDLTPQQVTRTMRRYFDESRRKKHRGARKVLSNVDYELQRYNVDTEQNNQHNFSEVNRERRRRPQEDDSFIDVVPDTDDAMKVTDRENLTQFVDS
jgi:hypothetical protein